MIRLFVCNIPLLYLLFTFVCYIGFFITNTTEVCLGQREDDKSTLMEVHSIAMLTGFLLPVLSIFRLYRRKVIVIIPLFIDLATSYIIHRIGTFFVTFFNLSLMDSSCSKDNSQYNGVNHYSYTIVYFLLVFIHLLSNNDMITFNSESFITFHRTKLLYIPNQYMLLRQSFGPFSTHYTCLCNNILKERKCVFHSMCYVILSIYAVSSTICVAHLVLHGYSTMNQVLFGVLLAYLMIFTYDFIVYVFQSLSKSIFLIVFMYYLIFLIHAFVDGNSVGLEIYHFICIVDIVCVWFLKFYY